MKPATIDSALQRILLIDDEPSVLFALKLLLEALRFSVTEFATPVEALSQLQQNARFDLCICDLKMPKMNGIRVLEETRRICPELPFVLMSAHANAEDIARAMSLGAVGFLAKPFTPEQIKDIVSKIDAQHQAPASG